MDRKRVHVHVYFFATLPLAYFFCLWTLNLTTCCLLPPNIFKQQSVQNYMEYLVLPESSQRALVIGEIWGSLTNHCPFYRRYKLSLDQKISLDRKVSSKQQLSFELKLTLDLKSAIFRFKDLFRCKGLSRPAKCQPGCM